MTALRCIVVVPSPVPGGEPDWRVIFANGDETAARKAATDWLAQNPASEAHLFIRDDTARVETRVAWSKA